MPRFETEEYAYVGIMPDGSEREFVSADEYYEAYYDEVEQV